MYFANEDGYYVLETHGGGMSIVSTSEWLDKYPTGSATWHIYTDYIYQGSNYRTPVRGIGNGATLVDGIGTIGQWNKVTMSHNSGEQFTLYMDASGTARVKFGEWVTNSEAVNPTFTSGYDFEWTPTPGQKISLVDTQNLIAQGYSNIILTISGTVSGDDVIWYGDDVWENGEFGFKQSQLGQSIIVNIADTSKFSSGSMLTLQLTSGSADITVSVIPDETTRIPPNLTVEQQMLASWSNATSIDYSAGTAEIPANAQLQSSFFKKAWEAGYTHLVFTYTSNNTAGSYIHGGTWNKYWAELGDRSGTDIRIDINEFRDGDIFYNLVFQAQTEGMTISNVRLYKSPETLEWTKSLSNIYFAIEDGYYVFSAEGAAYVSSPTEWLANMPVNSTWYVYTDYLRQGGNYRSLVWGIGAAGTLTDAIGTIGQWNAKSAMNSDGYSNGEMFTLYMDVAGTARVKMSDFVSNRTHYGTEYTYEVVDNDTIHFASTLNEHKLYLTNTQELIAQGYTKVTITIEGSFTEGSQLWYGNDDWGTAGCMNGVTLVDGKAVCEFDLSKMTTSNPYLVLMVSGTTGVDVDITITPSK